MFAISGNTASNPINRYLRGVPLAAALLACCVSAHAAPIPGLGTWETTLQARDINADGNADAYYDTVNNVTWLANVKAGAGSAFDDGGDATDGRMSFAGATGWLATLNVYGVTGWRFPHEIGSLYYGALGNSGDPSQFNTGWYNTGPFANVTRSHLSGWFWTGGTLLPDPADPSGHLVGPVFAADGTGARIYYAEEHSAMSVWAVHSGDVPVATIPEPQTYALMLAGLGFVACVARRRRA